MLNPDPAKLRVWGFDLRPRLRRRTAVVLKIFVYLQAMALLSQETDSRIALQRYHLGFWIMSLVSFLFSFGIFREGGPVKAFREPVWPLKGIKGGAVLVRGLDGLAEYRFGTHFEALPEAQQSEVLGAFRAGDRFFPADASRASTRLDERERIEKDRAYSRTLAALTQYLFIMAGVLGFCKKGMTPADLTALLLTFGFLGQNGPKIAVLWDEPAPPSADSDLRLVRAAEAENAAPE